MKLQAWLDPGDHNHTMPQDLVSFLGLLVLISFSARHSLSGGPPQ